VEWESIQPTLGTEMLAASTNAGDNNDPHSGGHLHRRDGVQLHATLPVATPTAASGGASVADHTRRPTGMHRTGMGIFTTSDTGTGMAAENQLSHSQQVHNIVNSDTGSRLGASEPKESDDVDMEGGPAHAATTDDSTYYYETVATGIASGEGLCVPCSAEWALFSCVCPVQLRLCVPCSAVCALVSCACVCVLSLGAVHNCSLLCVGYALDMPLTDDDHEGRDFQRQPETDSQRFDSAEQEGYEDFDSDAYFGTATGTDSEMMTGQ
jgi:hypothetical protein